MAQPDAQPRGKKRKARRQATDIEGSVEEHGGVYNIWYGKRTGVSDWESWKERREAKLAGPRYRCIPARDSGETRSPANAYICVFFARGKCVKGPQCQYLHRIPIPEDAARIDPLHDVFGRERHRTNRDDMGGVGSFERDCKTLFVGGWRRRNDIEDVIRQEFSIWGEIIYLRIIQAKSIAFVTFKHRTMAEFAKEAMADQCLSGTQEILNVRWATEDPNPRSENTKERDVNEEAVQAVGAHFGDTFNQYQALAHQQYPQTDTQYRQVGAEAATPLVPYAQDAETAATPGATPAADAGSEKAQPKKRGFKKRRIDLNDDDDKDDDEPTVTPKPAATAGPQPAPQYDYSQYNQQYYQYYGQYPQYQQQQGQYQGYYQQQGQHYAPNWDAASFEQQVTQNQHSEKDRIAEFIRQQAAASK